MKISIYINYFNSAHLLETESLVPIQTGRAIAKHRLPMLGDDAGDNMSAKNPAYCELTGQYWVWKNDKTSDYVGFMHYRRLFDFYPELKNRVVDAAGVVVEERFTKEMLDRYGLNDDAIRECVEGYDMILPEPWNVSPSGSKTIYEHYKSAPAHHIEDLERAGEIINATCPEFYPDFKTVMNSEAGFFTNMFVFRREIFEEYSQWLFKILSELEGKIDTTGYDASECRAIGYIAERMMGVFATHVLRTRPTLKVRYLRRVFVRDTKPYALCPPVPQSDLPLVSIVAATDHNYVSHMAALIASVFSNASRSRFIDFLILDGGITDDDRHGLRMLERLHPHARISFIDMSMQFLDIEAHMYFTRATFYRLALPDIVLDRPRLLFLDTDVVVLDDVSKVFDTDLGGKSIAAVRDLIMRAFVVQGVPSIATLGGKPSMKYLSDYLGLGDDHGNYFQAGVILFDLEKLRALNMSEKMIADLRNRRYWFLDQDVLNKHLARDVKYLSSNWNCVSLPAELGGVLPDALNREYERSIQAPSIIHYAGGQKPWDNFDSFFAHYYWYYLRLTPWYERVLARMVNAGPKTATSARKTTATRWMASRIWRSMPGFMRRRLWNTAVALEKRL
ncbi:DUF4422 domain-containing protein [Caballeronia sp. AZ10_KS36]|uniref:DUF4422 domain-containing protein n=1 Tax=Caballeronia sp. AZ10_KS36 TaxID=2921757 RepID=UPI0020284C04|nr:DUF4422 domain-containing protein [Caballeronia sp. AZ10_KS36]